MSERTKRSPSAFPLDSIDIDITSPPPPVATPARATEEAASISGETGDAASVCGAAEPDRRSRWGALLFAALAGLASLAFGLAIDQFLRELFLRNDWLGWLGAGLTGLAGLAVCAIAVREIAGLIRLRRITHLRQRAEKAVGKDDRRLARSVIEEVMALYGGRPETARGRAALADHRREIVDGRDLMRLVEREILHGFDDEARRMVAASARRVSVVTAVSPRAFVDVLFVLAECLRLIRRLSRLYGGRPGALGLARLSRTVIAHLAVTGGMAIGDGLVQQVIGHGLAARLSARLGEGVVNGLLTARVGIAAIDVCRPLPFVDTNGPRISDFVGEIARIGETGAKRKSGRPGDRLMR